MEGKKRKKKVGGIILLCMSFLLVIVLTFTITLAWFFDGDWSSNYVTMAGSVGIEIRDETVNPALTTSGAGKLHFNISTNLAYPGQAIDASASVYNNGGISVSHNGKTGSDCYIRARFLVHTNIGSLSQSFTEPSPVMPSIRTDFPDSKISKEVVLSYAPFAYRDTDSFAGQRIIKIGAFVARTTSLTNAYMTVYVIKANKAGQLSTLSSHYVSEHKVNFAQSDLGSSTTVNKFVYGTCDIQLREDETLAFGKNGDPITWNYVYPDSNSNYSFYMNNNTVGSGCIVFDCIADVSNASQDATYVNAQIIYNFLQNLVSVQNNQSIDAAPYYWQYFTREGGCGLSSSGISDQDVLYYLEGQASTTKQTGKDEGYFYLCQKSAPGATNGYLYPLQVGESSVFLWNDQFIIPWQLTNYSADKHIFVAVEFQAIQTFIPKIEEHIINSDPNNQAHDNTRSQDSDPYYVLYNNESVQTVFNSCVFPDVGTIIDGIDFSEYATTSRPS